ncbi:REP-associated tyrosine transposase [Uliginosibacterium gangwonense]|uniref:REP-associated tyrosine transposase n=1 Tax=Uliginosibacterium gangwonense TaxID=392736 RepID=UPI00037D6216|nr:hypothetical protein [Uliginosibacterium gangwonense]
MNGCVLRITTARQNHPFMIDAWVLLPDHLHCIWTLPEGDADFGVRWNLIKRLTSSALPPDLLPSQRSYSQTKRRESGFWQRHFWEYLIRDEADYRYHMDYLHYNPVKHKQVAQVIDWPYSSFHRLLKAGIYPANWGNVTPALM